MPFVRTTILAAFAAALLATGAAAQERLKILVPTMEKVATELIHNKTEKMRAAIIEMKANVEVKAQELEAQRAQLVSKGLIVDDHGVPHGSGHASRAERPGLSVQGRGNERGSGHGHQPHSPRAGRRSPGSQPKSRRNNSLGGDGDGPGLPLTTG